MKVKRNFLTKKSVAYALTFIFIITLIPILMLSFYTHSFADDYNFSSGVYIALESNGNFFQ